MSKGYDSWRWLERCALPAGGEQIAGTWRAPGNEIPGLILLRPDREAQRPVVLEVRASDLPLCTPEKVHGKIHCSLGPKEKDLVPRGLLWAFVDHRFIEKDFLSRPLVRLDLLLAAPSPYPLLCARLTQPAAAVAQQGFSF